MVDEGSLDNRRSFIGGRVHRGPKEEPNGSTDDPQAVAGVHGKPWLRLRFLFI